MRRLNMPHVPEVELRYERKFLVEDLDAYKVRLLIRLHPALFYAPYPPRQVNSLYLDSPELEYYYDNVRGAAERKKVRLRWYGNLLGEIAHPTLEIKHKRGLVGNKESYPLAALHLADGFNETHFQQVAGASNLPEGLRWMVKGLNVTLLNCYQREYYVSRDQRFRLTLDYGMSFYHANNALGNTFTHRQIARQQIILELKYHPQHEFAAPRIAGYFPFRVTRSSKYVQGMERVYF